MRSLVFMELGCEKSFELTSSFNFHLMAVTLPNLLAPRGDARYPQPHGQRTEGGIQSRPLTPEPLHRPWPPACCPRQP